MRVGIRRQGEEGSGGERAYGDRKRWGKDGRCDTATNRTGEGERGRAREDGRKRTGERGRKKEDGRKRTEERGRAREDGRERTVTMV